MDLSLVSLYWFPFTPYKDVFPRLFPWADFSADEDFFEDDDESLWRELHCHYDKEDDEWIIVGDTFEEFRSKLNSMRSKDHSGEVAEYMMTLSLNDLGRSFWLCICAESANARPAEAGRNRS